MVTKMMFCLSTLRTALARVAVAMGFLICAGAGPATADSLFRSMATEIIEGIRRADTANVPAISGYGRPTIAVQAFAENEVPIPTAVANSWNRKLLAELQRLAGGQFQFVDRSALPALIRDIEGSSRDSREKLDRIAALKQNARADILIAGSITLPGPSPVLSYQAIGISNGRLLASSSPRRVPFPDKVAAVDKSQRFLRTTRTYQPIERSVPVRRPPGFRPTVLEAERLLISLGYDPGLVDGVLTIETRRALRAYQANSALPVNGRMTWHTVENLRRDTRR